MAIEENIWPRNWVPEKELKNGLFKYLKQRLTDTRKKDSKEKAQEMMRAARSIREGDNSVEN